MRPFDIWRSSINDGKGNLTKIVFEYDLPTKDSIFNQSNYFFVTNPLADDLKSQGLSGFDLRPVITSYSEKFPEIKNLPPVWQLLLNGEHGKDDFGLISPIALIISERVVSLLKKHGSYDVQFFDYDPNYKRPIPAWMLEESGDDV